MTITKTNELYELMGEHAELKLMIAETDDKAEIMQTLKDTIQANEESIGGEIEDLIAMQREHEAEAEKFKREKEYFVKKEKEHKEKAELIKNFIAETLQNFGLDHKNKKKIETKFGKVGFQKNPPSLLITNATNIPMEFEKIVEPSYDTKALLAKIKEEVDFSKIDEIDLTEKYGVKVVNDSSHLRIR